jgi:hypothetical protein
MDESTDPVILSILHHRQNPLDSTCIICVKDTIIVFLGISHRHVYTWSWTLDIVQNHDKCINVSSLQISTSYLYYTTFTSVPIV